MRRMLELSGLRPGETLYDMGSGDGRVLIMAAADFEAHCVGVEVDPGRNWIAARRVRSAGVGDDIELVRADFFDVDVSEADVVTLYLRQPTNDRLEEKLARELRPGARVVSNTYTLPTLPLIAADRKLRVYVYEVPEE